MISRLPPGAQDPDVAKSVDVDDRSMVALLRDLVHELSSLFRKELSLATTEISGILPRFMLAFGSAAAGGVVLFGGFLLLLAAAALALAQVMSAWLAALLVGLAAAVVGYAMLHAGLKKVKPSTLTPERALDSLKQDKAVLTRSAR